jgi:hypothetical protein
MTSCSKRFDASSLNFRIKENSSSLNFLFIIRPDEIIFSRYLYTFSPSSLNTIYPWTNYKLIYPFNNQLDTLKYYQDLGVKNITKNALLRSNKNNSNLGIENFDNTNNNIECFQNYNILYLTILCILIVIYFIRSKK